MAQTIHYLGGFMKFKSLTSGEITLTAAMVALSLILTFLEIPFNPAIGLKIDFALVPIVIVAVLINRYAGIIALIVQFILVFFRNPAGWLFNAVAGFYFIVTLIIILTLITKVKTKHKITPLFISLLIATIATTILTTLTNYAILIPMLFPKFALSLNQSFALYGPFNLLKFSLVSAVSLMVIPQLQKRLSK